MDEKTLLELRQELDSITIQLTLQDDFIQSFSFCLLESLRSSLPPEQLHALKEDFLQLLHQQQNQSLEDLKDTIDLSVIERNRLRMNRNIQMLRKMYEAS